MEWMNPQTLSAIGALVMSVIAALREISRDRSRAPIEKDTAEAATTDSYAKAGQTTVAMALSVNERLSAENTRMVEEIESNRKKLLSWNAWYVVLLAEWDTFRAKRIPPERPEDIL